MPRRLAVASTRSALCPTSSTLTMEQQLAQCLEGTLSADAVVRTQAEAALLQLHNERSCGLSLAHLTLSPSLSPTIRKSSAVSLRKWIRERWSGLFDGFVGFSPSGEPLNSEEKIPIRTALLEMLTLRGSESRRLRVIGAACLSSVCSSDWPDDFPELLPTVQGLLRGGEQDCLHGALSFLSEFWTSEMDERQILGGAREMLPTIEALLGNEVSKIRGSTRLEKRLIVSGPISSDIPTFSSRTMRTHLQATSAISLYDSRCLQGSFETNCK